MILLPSQEEIENKSVELADSEFAEPGLPHDLERAATRMALWMRSEVLRLNETAGKMKKLAIIATHNEIIYKHLESGTVHKASIESYLDSGRVSGGLYVAIKKCMEEYANQPCQSQGGFTENLPTDTETEKWFSENIGNDKEKPCSASSAIYKFRLWLKERQNEQD